MVKHVLLILKAPMQSWGISGKLRYRSTYIYPTKSGLIGLMSGAIGFDREDDNNLRFFDDLEINSYRLSEDYVILQDFFHASNVVKVDQILENKKEYGSLIGKKEYIHDGIFAGIVSGDEQKINRIANGLKNPVYGIFLGRKCCVPSTRVFQGIFDDLESAIEKMRTFAKTDKISCLSDATFANKTDILCDVPISFAPSRRKFGKRFVKEYII